MSDPIWILPAVALALHGRLLAAHGGADGIRDRGALEAALDRPRQMLAYRDATLFDIATAYAGGMVRNHPFVDGNKRVGFMLAYVFLRANGFQTIADEAEATVMTVGLAASTVSEAEYAAWLERNVEAVKPGD